jgi:hypothetical protein
MKEITEKLHKLSIEKDYKINKIIKLIKQHKDRKLKSK